MKCSRSCSPSPPPIETPQVSAAPTKVESLALYDYQQLTVIVIPATLNKVNVHLGSAFDEFVAELLKSGYYQTQSEVLREGLRLLKDREEMKQMRLAELRKEIAVGSAQADRGEFVDGQEAFTKIRQRSARRKRPER